MSTCKGINGGSVFKELGEMFGRVRGNLIMIKIELDAIWCSR
jgi:hypothetical protein